MKIIPSLLFILVNVILIYLFFAHRKKKINPIAKVIFVLISALCFFYTAMTIYAIYYVIFKKGPL